MSVKILILAIFVIAIANCSIDPDFRTKHYIPKTPSLPTYDVVGGKRMSEIRNPKVSPYIAGGTVVSPPHKYPFLVALYIDSLYQCGGSLISNEWVVTAAHCVFGAGAIIVQMGAHNISENEATQVNDEATEFIVHENFSSLTFANDIGLIHLPLPAVTFTNEIGPISLPSASDLDLEEGVPVTIAGWGEITGGFSDLPYEATVSTISNEQCAAGYGASITDGSLCTSGNSGKGACDDDGGGPVIYQTITGVELRGVISFEGACGNSYPTAHTRVTHYLDWIYEHTGIA